MYTTKLASFALLVCLGSQPAWACDCHGGGPSFGSFAGWAQMPTMNCIPSHASDNLGLGQEQTGSDGADNTGTHMSEQAASSGERESTKPEDQSDS